ncbi:saccharopine dehydrogenase NADP-binding domain-containing protein [candidate division KSB1 bacterium]
MKKVLILGAGFVTKPMFDYFINICHYHVTVASRTVSKAQRLFNGYENGAAVPWIIDDHEMLDKLVSESDLVVSMIPPRFAYSRCKSVPKIQKKPRNNFIYQSRITEFGQRGKEKRACFS